MYVQIMGTVVNRRLLNLRRLHQPLNGHIGERYFGVRGPVRRLPPKLRSSEVFPVLVGVSPTGGVWVVYGTIFTVERRGIENR